MDLHEVATRLALAALCGAILGAHFEVRNRPAGLRTHTITSLAAALFCITAARVDGAGASEVARVMQGIASGVGFIGAAAVLRRGARVEGVSNAASLWITAAIGCEAAVGEPWIGVTIAVCVAVLVVVVDGFERWMHRTPSPHDKAA